MLHMIQIEIHPPIPDGQFAGAPDVSKTLISLIDASRIIQVLECQIPSLIAGMTKPATLWTVAELGNLISPMTIEEAKIFLATSVTRH